MSEERVAHPQLSETGRALLASGLPAPSPDYRQRSLPDEPRTAVTGVYQVTRDSLFDRHRIPAGMPVRIDVGHVEWSDDLLHAVTAVGFGAETLELVGSGEGFAWLAGEVSRRLSG